MTTNIILCGVGGQGIILASTVISKTMLEAGYDVKTNEIHGMAQRGGSVVAQIRFGQKVFSPIIKKGTADFMLGLEKIEPLRYVDYVKPDAVVIVADTEIIPVTVTSGSQKYPENPEELLSSAFNRLHVIDSLGIARKVGEPRASNVVMIGALSNYLSVEPELWEDVLKSSLPAKVVELNMEAFRMGRSAIVRGG